MSMTKREKILIVIVLILAVFFVYYMYILQPTLNKLKALEEDNGNKMQSISTNAQIQAMISEVDNKITGDKNQIASYGESILSKFDQPAAIVYLYDTISQYGEKVMFSFEEVKDVTLIDVNRTSVTFNATYDGLKSIVKALNEGAYYIKITGINATSAMPEEVAAQPDDGTQPATTPAVTPPVPTVKDGTLSITMTLEFYNFDGEIPPDKEYSFTNGASYGGDIFF